MAKNNVVKKCQVGAHLNNNFEDDKSKQKNNLHRYSELQFFLKTYNKLWHSVMCQAKLFSN